MPTLPAVSREYLYIPGIRAFDVRSPDYPVDGDPTGLPVQVAFLPNGVYPVEADWNDAEWADTTTARILVGPPTLALEGGQYKVWLRVTGATERPERPLPGELNITSATLSPPPTPLTVERIIDGMFEDAL